MAVGMFRCFTVSAGCKGAACEGSLVLDERSGHCMIWKQIAVAVGSVASQSGHPWIIVIS